MRHLQNNIIPFLHLSLPNIDLIPQLTVEDVIVPPQVNRLISTLLRRLDDNELLKEKFREQRLSISNFQCNLNCESQLSRLIYYINIKSTMYRYRNYRGIEQRFEQLVTTQISRETRKLISSSIKISIIPDLKELVVNLDVKTIRNK